MRAELESDAATPADVVRKEEREANGIAFAKGLPVKRDGTYVCGSGGKAHKHLVWKSDRHRLMISNMQGPIEFAADERYGSKGTARTEERDMFFRLVKEEKDKDKAKEPNGKAKRAKGQSTGSKDKAQNKKWTAARRPYIARAALGLMVLFASILG